MCLSVCVCPYVCVNVCGCDCVFVHPQHKYLIFRLYCVAVCCSASHATINTGAGGDRRLWIAAVCVGRHQAVNPSRYHWQAKRWEINIYSKLPQITSRDFSLLFLSLLRPSSVSVGQSVLPLPILSPRYFSLIPFSLSIHCFPWLSFPPSWPPTQNTQQSRGPCRRGTQVMFPLKHTHRLAQKWVQTYIYINMLTTHVLTHTQTHAGSAWDIHLGFVMSDMAHVSLFCNYGSIYFFRSSRWVRNVPWCGLDVETHSAQDIQLSRKKGAQYID